MYDTKNSDTRDKQFAEFVDAYPVSRRSSTPKAHAAFVRALQAVTFETLLHALEQHKRSEQWGKFIIPSLVTWLEESRWEQVLPESERMQRRYTENEKAKRLGLK